MANERVKLQETANNYRLEPVGQYLTSKKKPGERVSGATLYFGKGLLDVDGNIVYDDYQEDNFAKYRLEGTTFLNYINETLGTFLATQGVNQAVIDAIPTGIKNMTYKDWTILKMNNYALTQNAGSELEDE